MAKRKQRIVLEGFTFAFNKFIIEQEVETDDDSSFPDGVRQAISRVMSAPAQLIALEANPTDTPQDRPLAPDLLVSEPTKKRRRRGRRQPSEADPLAAGSDPEAVTPPSRSASKPSSARDLILEMHRERFFAQDRSIGEIREELHTRGHAFKSNQLSPALLSLTQKKSLARKKDEHGNWTYRDGRNGQS